MNQTRSSKQENRLIACTLFVFGVSTMIFAGSTGGSITPAVVGMVAVTVLLLGTILFSVCSKGGNETEC